jgi:catechol 2,3-dioxygenase-like lactoylglutathione lyase family enzyme
MLKLTSTLFLAVLLFFSACQQKEEAKLAAFEVYCEMVANGAKPIALGQPMESEELDQYWDDLVGISEQYNLAVFREKNFPVTVLFPAVATYEKEVPVIYKDDIRFRQYLQFKMDNGNIEEFDAARRMGRLLGYSTEGINELLMKNTEFKTISSFSVGKQTTHFYYEDVEAARSFYTEKLGFNEVEPYLLMISPDTYLSLHAHDEVHPSDQPNSTALALLTDQLPQWYQHIRSQRVLVRYEYKARPGSPHDGFVVEDPEGYLLEFEQFKQHPENERFFAILEDAPRVQTSIYPLNFHGSITWTYHVDLVKMQTYYEEVLGYPLVADQGWTKIYQTSPTGFIGLVDECRGMEDFAPSKAVELEWSFDEIEALSTYLTATSEGWNENSSEIIGPERYTYRIR